ncbi:MAG: heat-shock protein Hsp70, partial [Acidobacteria bacterium]|nr:heat-shock protein Hsp70 [Acidobacteriota bacterium]
VRILNEPTAAALAHGLNRQDSQICLVYDLGGGTFDVSVVERVGEVVEVLASHGNTQLGGDDFDRILRSRLIAGFREDSGADLSKDLRALARLTFAAEQAKIRLSSEPFAVVAEEFIASRDGAPLNLHREISRREFEQWIAALVESTRESIRQALSDAGLAADRVQKVLLVGGSTHIPLVWELIEGELGQAPHAEVDPALAVALGAAIQAGIIANESVDMILVDVAAHSLGIEVLEDSQHLLIPDAFSRIIPRNTVLPAQKSEVYSTSTDYQKAASIRIYQGEHEVTSRNTLLGEFLVDGLRRAPAGEVEIVVSFAYDTSGLLHVTASERGAGTSRELTVRTLEPSSAAEPASDPPAADGRTGASASTESRVLLGRARAVLDRLSGDSRGRLEAAIRRLEQALPAGGSEAEEAQQELLDLLYELEE